MPRPDIFVVGASTGGVEALGVLASGLPVEFDAALFVTLHIGAGPSALDTILSRAGPLPAKRPKDGEQIERGTIYVAPPDHHMLVPRRTTPTCDQPDVPVGRPQSSWTCRGDNSFRGAR